MTIYEKIRTGINEHGWDGNWYIRAFSDTESGSVRRASRGPLPAIFMSGDVTPEAQHRCERVGWPLLDKPFAVADMRAAIDRICEIS